MPDDGRVVYLEPSKFGLWSRHKNWVAYTQAVNLERRKLAETALAYIILHNPHLVGSVLHKVSAGIVHYWLRRREQLGHQKYPNGQAPAQPPWAPAPPREWRGPPEHLRNPKHALPISPVVDPASLNGKYPVAWNALEKTKTYTHGETSYGRMDTNFPAQLDVGVRQNLAALHGNSIPKTLNAHDNFLRVFCHLGPADIISVKDPKCLEWLEDRRPKEAKAQKQAKELREFWRTNSGSWKRLEGLEIRLRPSIIFDEKTPGARGRSDAKPRDANATLAAGLLPEAPGPYLHKAWERIRKDWFKQVWAQGRGPNAPVAVVLPIESEARKRGIDQFLSDPKSDFMKVVNANNLIFAAGQSGTTSTLFQSAMLFGNLASKDDLKTYLMAIVAYLVGGGMHSCHELFKTAELVGIEYRVGEYDGAIPEHIRRHELYKKWKHEFADVVGPVRFR
jgi:hypothetical protein